MKNVKLPLVTFYGRIPEAELRTFSLVPSVPAIEVRGVLVATTRYTWTTDKDGRFSVEALGTNVGVNTGWKYRLLGGNQDYFLTLPYGSGPISYASLVSG